MDISPTAKTDLRDVIPVRSKFYLLGTKRLWVLWPALLATGLFLGLIGHQIIAVKALENGRYVYTLDDTYAHLAIAKSLWQHGVWSFNAANGFESGSSSLLWPLLITVCFAIFGIHEYFPLILNILAAIGLIFYAGEAIRRMTGSSLLNLLILCGIVVLTPLPAVVSTGMEHSLQILLSLVFVDIAARLLMDGSEAVTHARTAQWLCVSGVLLVLTRYEGLFLIAAVGLLLLCRKRWKLAMILGVVTAAPLVIFGMISVAKGWAFLPNSLLLKGNTHITWTFAGLLQYLSIGYDLMLSQPHVLMMIAAAVAALLGSLQRRWNVWTYPTLVLLLVLIVAAQHLQFASVGWFYRYEAYLVTLVLFGVGIALGYDHSKPGFRYWFRPAALPHIAALGLAALLFGAPLWLRARTSYPHIVTASYSIYEQQYQMGRFVRRFYQGKGVIANDVGAISFLGDNVRLLDTVGLSNIEVLRARKGLWFDHAMMQRLSKRYDAEIAIVYDEWAYMYGGIPPEWVQVGRWTNPQNKMSAFDHVSFYATSSAQVPRLTQALQEFGQSLPKDMLQDGIYCGANSLNATGVYGMEGPKDSAFFWTQQWAQFYIYPAENEPLGADDTTIRLSVLPITPGQTLSVYFNDALVETKVFPPVGPPNWMVVTVKTKWHAGANVLRLVGVGQTAQPPQDGRTLLFATLDPRRMTDETGAVVAQPGVAQGTK